MSESNKDIVQDSLDGLSEDLLDGDLTDGEPYRQINYGEELQGAHDKAAKTVNALLKFYFDEKLISDDEYISFKKATSEQTISQLMFLMRTSQEVLIKLMQNIDAGDMQPRMFEVLSTLQRSHLDIIKSYSMSIVATEEEIRRMQMDYADNHQLGSSGNNGQLSEGDGDGNTLTTNNPKDLLKALEEGRNDEDMPSRDLEAVKAKVKKKADELKPKNKKLTEQEVDEIEDADFTELDEY